MIKNLKDVMIKFADEATCRQFLIQQRWDGSPICPYCNSEKWYSIENGKRFKCGNKQCYKKYSVTVGTVFHASNIPLSTWFPAMYIITAHKKGISSVQLAKDLGVTQKTAWFILHRIRESLKEKGSNLLSNVVEVDETFMGGHAGNKSLSKRKKLKAAGIKGYMDKTPVVGLMERGGKLKVKVVDSVTQATLQPLVKESVDSSAVLVTDNFWGYRGLDKHFSSHQIINHTLNEYVNGDIHTNTIEGFWGLFKRSVYGIYHQISPKHMQRYCDESAFRYNNRHIGDAERFVLSLGQIAGSLSYKELIHGKVIIPSKKESGKT
jgi:transposase-like protein